MMRRATRKKKGNKEEPDDESQEVAPAAEPASANHNGSGQAVGEVPSKRPEDSTRRGEKKRKDKDKAKNVRGRQRQNGSPLVSAKKGAADKYIDLKSCLPRLKNSGSPRDTKRARAGPRILPLGADRTHSGANDTSFGCEGMVYNLARAPISIESVRRKEKPQSKDVPPHDETSASNATAPCHDTGPEFVPVRGEHADHRLKLLDILIEIKSREDPTGVEVRSLAKAVGVMRLKEEFGKLSELRQQKMFDVTFLCQDDKGVKYFVPEHLVPVDGWKLV